MSRLHTNWSRSLLREKSSVNQSSKNEEGKKVLVRTGGVEDLKTLEEAANILVTIPGLIYQFDEKDGNRVNQRFYSRGKKIKLSGEEIKRDVVYDIHPLFPEGHIVPRKRFDKGDLVVSVPGTNHIFKYRYNNLDDPDRSSVTAEFIIAPTFVSFDGVKSVDPNANGDESEEESDEESEEG